MVQAMHANLQKAPHAEPPMSGTAAKAAPLGGAAKQISSPAPQTLPARSSKPRTTEEVMRRSELIFRDLDQVQEADRWR